MKDQFHFAGQVIGMVHERKCSQVLEHKTATNREFAAMLADEYKLIFISLSAHIQPTEFY